MNQTTHYVRITPVGGCQFNATLRPFPNVDELPEPLGSFEAGDIDDEDQWVGDDDEIIAACREQFSLPAAMLIRVEG